MSDSTRSAADREPAEPPGGGRQDHNVMREAAMRPVTGPASTDTLAASGGLDVPGREAHPELAAGAVSPQDAPAPPVTVDEAASPPEPIPGERDRTTLTHREPGAVGGAFAGADVKPPDPHHWMDERTAHERALEGGGDYKKR